MTNLVLELRAGDLMVINGAPIRFRTKARIELASRARFLFGKQIMTVEQANSPARRIYFMLQTAYLGEAEESPPRLAIARELIEEFQAVTTSLMAREILDRAMRSAETGDYYRSLKLLKRIIRHEDSVLDRDQPDRLPVADSFGEE
jgi:flagellar protein FlbT